mgnify:FL=1
MAEALKLLAKLLVSIGVAQKLRADKTFEHGGLTWIAHAYAVRYFGWIIYIDVEAVCPDCSTPLVFSAADHGDRNP